MQKIPICRVCPNCGCAEHHPVKPRTWVYFAPDRLCVRCLTDYSPPTPVWAALAFLILGGALAAFFVPSLLFAAQRMDTCNFVSSAVLGTIGVLCAARGVGYLVRRPLPPPPAPPSVEPVAKESPDVPQ
jgi:hypothetical protein